ncbi:MAG TPA: hypothetical protein PKA05_00560 [Roseiflexaceae bacterium]|nr:hypothetical protein [Roseiflexaceae bacterium]HMP38847.1 hypothetical protein [Roseiflexaceae bacterium]
MIRPHPVEITVIGVCVALTALLINTMLAGRSSFIQIGALLLIGVLLGAAQALLRALRLRRFAPGDAEASEPPSAKSSGDMP